MIRVLFSFAFVAAIAGLSLRIILSLVPLPWIVQRTAVLVVVLWVLYQVLQIVGRL